MNRRLDLFDGNVGVYKKTEDQVSHLGDEIQKSERTESFGKDRGFRVENVVSRNGKFW